MGAGTVPLQLPAKRFVRERMLQQHLEQMLCLALGLAVLRV